MYALTLWVHSWLRWAVLALALVVLVRGLRGKRAEAPWLDADERWTRRFLAALNAQFTIGLLLYVGLSPIVHAALRDLGGAMRSSVLRFFVVEHITAMVIAVGVAHAGLARARRLQGAPARHRRTATTAGLFLICVAIGIPWPFRPYGRPLARTSVESSASDHASLQPAESVYAARCAVCHGASGHGDGVAAGAMQPPPRDFRDGAWQHSVSDQRIAEVIARGGIVHGLSTDMPPNPDLDPSQIEALVAFVRAAGKLGD